MLRRLFSFAALAIGVAILAARIHQINKPEPSLLAARTLHLLYLDSLRTELLTFAEQYGRPLFVTDTTPLINGHGRIQASRLREALFDPRIEYHYGDYGFTLDWASDPKPRMRHGVWMPFGSPRSKTIPGQTPWPPSAVQYAELRRLAITPQWPEPPQRRANRARRSPVPPRDGSAWLLSLATSH